MFFARWELGAPWNASGIEGTVRWLRRVWAMFTEPVPNTSMTCSEDTRRVLRRRVHQMLKRITRDFKQFEFNTIVSGLMKLLNDMTAAREAGVYGTPEWNEAMDIYLRMLAPVTPHIAEELWEQTGRKYSVHRQPWPQVDEEAVKEEEITIPVQINGKLRDRLVLPADSSEEEIKSAALASSVVQKFLQGKSPRKVIVAQKKLVNIVL
jgi:leucyl-tRNA synthetase